MLLNVYQLEQIGLNNGIEGISFALFYISRRNNNILYTHAFSLLKRALIIDTENMTLSHGKAGLAVVLAYLIRNNMISASYNEIFSDEHLKIIEYLQENASYQENFVECVDFLVFLLLTV